jgi:hypothetical protein
MTAMIRPNTAPSCPRNRVFPGDKKTMRRFLLLIISLWQQRFKLYFFAALIGALTGVLIFYPIYDFIFFYESEGTSDDIQVQINTALTYVYSQLKTSLIGGTPGKTLFLVRRQFPGHG